jgi:diguanylate cyclase (GGDEF)-like protein
MSADQSDAQRQTALESNNMTAVAQCNIGGEDARLAALHRYDVLDTQPEEVFDRITRLVKVVLEMPMAAVSLVDRDRQWFKSKQGLKAPETPRNISFCTHTIQGTKPLIVNDAHTDPRFATSPLVTGDPHIRFYVGVPLRSRDGYNVGALCSMDTKVRDLTPEQVIVLEDLARLIVDELELRVQASTDALTGVMSRRALQEQAEREIARASRYGSPLSCALIDADHFKAINDTYGHGVGDLALKHLASICSKELRTSDCIGRIGGEEFAIMLPETKLGTAIEVAERLRKIIASSPLDVGQGRMVKLTASIGVAACAGSMKTFDALLSNADFAMYDAKNCGRNRVASYLGKEISLLRRSDERNDAVLALAS